MPLSHGLDVGLIKWIKRLAQGSKDPPFSANSCPGQQSSTQGRSQACKCKVGAIKGRDEPEGGRPASPRPAGLGILPPGHRLLDSGSDLLLEAVDSCLGPTRACARPASLGEAGRPPSSSPRPFIAPTLRVDAFDLPWRWIDDMDMSLH